MSKVVRLSDFRPRRRLVVFTRPELNQLLSHYSRRVINGEWRDYAIDHGDGYATFSIFRHSSDRPIFTIVKYAKGSRRGGDFVVSSDKSPLKRGNTLGEALTVLENSLKLVSP